MSEPTPLEAIFFAALEKPAAERGLYLAEACRGDADLRRRVERMLTAQMDAASFLESPPSAIVREAIPTIDQAPLEKPGTQIGPYKLLQQIGEGGMGIVYMAEQHKPVKRRVALKIIKPGMDTRQVIARFEAERQALSLMDHPNIAKVLDAGTTGAGVPALAGLSAEDRLKAGLQLGRPYFVMELVKGQPITQYCDEKHLTPRQRLELLLPVCQAIQHAHQKGIIHRDIKPTNILVAEYDQQPVPKVIDFGVAKATGQTLTEKTMFTGLGQIVGTLEYMSPEQAKVNQLDIDTRSDIYSLGVLLYELLTGSTPFDRQRLCSAAFDEMLRIIREEEPPKPSTRLSDSHDSLPSISALRHTEPAKLTKLVRGELDWIVMKALEKDRNRRYETANAFAADLERYLADEAVQACPPSAGYRFRKFARRNKASLAFTGLVLLILLTLTGGIGWNVRDRAARQTAVEHEVKLALKEAEEWQVQGKWPEALSVAKRAEGLLAGGGSDELRERVHQLRKDLDMVLRLDDIRLLSSEWKDDKFGFESADQAYAQAFADYGIDVARSPANEAAARIRERSGVAIALAAALDDWAFTRNRTDKAGSLALTAVAQSADPDPWRRQVREAHQQKDGKTLAALAASPELLRQPPTSLKLLAADMRANGNAEGANTLLRQAQREYPGDFWINLQLAVALGRLESPYSDEAVSFNRAALAARPQSIAALNNLGLALWDAGKVDEAVAHFGKAIELDPKFSRAHLNLSAALRSQGKIDDAIAWSRNAIKRDPRSAAAHLALGIALVDQKKVDEGIGEYQRAIEINPQYARAHHELGFALGEQQKLSEAIGAYHKAIKINPKYADSYYNLGVVLGKQHKLPEAIDAYHIAIRVDPRHAKAYNNLGNALRTQQKLPEAIDAYRKAIEINPKYAIAHGHLGIVLRDQKKLDEAIAEYRKAIELDPKSAKAHSDLGTVLRDQKKLDEAIAEYRKAIELDPKSADAHVNLGGVLRDQKKLDEAIAEHRKAIELDPKLALAHYNLGTALSDQGKLDEAIAEYRKAIELDPKNAFAFNGLGSALAKKGWHLADDPDPKGRDPKRAVELVKEAVELAPKSVEALQYLGWVQYRAGNWKASIEALEKSCKLQEGGTGDSYQWIVLALAHAQLAAHEGLPEEERGRHRAESRRWYEPSAKDLDSKNWTTRPSGVLDQAVWDFRQEALKLIGPKEERN